ncbi:Hyalin [Holothuria leucospilota]|uniref:Hyalin n=1 Tax=Holothuria leucospilota TaxID=206669 RepID=A0A9Q1H7Z0_HOLLE|nr:Hyalin [Holothuria leucospilota]
MLYEMKYLLLFLLELSTLSVVKALPCRSGYCKSRGRTFRYGGKIGPECSYKDQNVQENAVCTSNGNTAPSYAKGMVTYGNRVANLPNKLICYGPDPRVSRYSGRNIYRQAPLVCRPLDATLPTVNCPKEVSSSADEDTNTSAIVQWSKVSCSDNSGENIAPNCSHQSGGKFLLGITQVNCTCTDSSQNIGRCSFNISVTDETPPAVNCPKEISNPANEDDNTTAIVRWNSVSCSDNSGQNIVPKCSYQSGNKFQLGNTSVVCYCTDNSQNTGRCSFIITVTDETPPTVKCPDETSNPANEDDNTTAIVRWNPAACSDNSGQNIESQCSSQSGNKFQLGNTSVVCFCTDNSQNTGRCSFIITVTDETPPTVNCPGDISNPANEDNNTKAIVRWNSASCSDNSGQNIEPQCSYQSGNKFQLGTTNVVCSCTDNSQNTGQCSFIITVTDETPPTVNCPDDKSNPANRNGNTKAIVRWNPAACSDNSRQNIESQCSYQSGNKFQLGNTSVVCSCTDNSQNTGRCSFIITVTDETPPTVNCPGEISNPANEDDNTKAIVRWNPASCSDNSGQNIESQCSYQSGNKFQLGNTSVVCSCTDNSQNTGQCSFIITVTDETPPIVNCPDHVSNPANEDDNTKAIVRWNPASCFDNSGQNILPDCSSQPGDKFQLGITNVECNCTDNSQNTGRCSFNITVTDETPPVVNCPDDVFNPANEDDNTKAIVRWNPVSCSDNSGQNIEPQCSNQSGDKFQLGITSVECNCTDNSQNTGRCSFIITVTDEILPTVYCPEGLSYPANEDNNIKAIVHWNPVSCSDNSGQNILPVCSNQPGDKFQLGNTSVECNCTDNSQNTGRCSFIITVTDETRPTVYCPNDIFNPANGDGNTTAIVRWNPVSCSDNSRQNIEPQCSNQSGDKFRLGNTSVECNCTDNSQNTGRCSFIIKVTDETPPTVYCPNDIFNPANEDGNTTAIVRWNPVSCSDNSRQNIEPQCSNQSGDKFQLGITSVECNCTDNSQNTGRCSFIILVTDETPPVVNCPDDIFNPANEDSNTTAIVRWNPVSCSDNSGQNIESQCSYQSGNKFRLGNTRVVCNCTDNSQNTGRCSFIITVTDEIVPMIHCPDDMSYPANDDDNTKAIVQWNQISCFDNSWRNIVPECSNQSGEKFQLGITKVECNCTDNSQNTGRCSFIITVRDETPPAVNCPDDISNPANEDDNTKAIVRWNPVSCFDNSGQNIEPQCSNQSGDKFQLGITSVVCSCTDNSQNTGRCSFIITVTDETPPTVNCPDDISNPANDDDITTAIVRWNPVSCFDNSGQNILPDCSSQPGEKFQLGITNVECNCTDNSQNTGRCSFNITVTDKTPPTVNCPDDISNPANEDDNTTAIVRWNPVSCFDNSGQNILPDCSSQPGEKFQLGITNVECNCTDNSQNTGRCSFNITVTDETPPTVNCPDDISNPANEDDNTTAIVRWNPVSCFDNSGQNILPDCSSQPGEKFQLGITNVECNCTDNSQNTGRCAFIITVTDKTKPLARCENDILSNQRVVPWKANCTDNSGEVKPAECNHADEHFDIGNTTVTCRCTDNNNNTNVCSFVVSVNVFCPEESLSTENGILSFPATKVNQSAYSLETCTSSNTSLAIIRCNPFTNGAAKWGVPQTQICVPVSSGNVEAYAEAFTENLKNVTAKNVAAVVNELKQVTESSVGTTVVIVKAGNILEEISEVNSSSPEVTKDFVEVVGKFMTNLKMSKQERPDEKDIEKEDKPKVDTDKILKSLEKQLRNVQSSSENLTSVQESIAVNVVHVTPLTEAITFINFKPKESDRGNRSDEFEVKNGVPNEEEQKEIHISIVIPIEAYEDYYDGNETMSIAFVLHRSSVLFNDHGASKDEILVNDVVISASTTKDIANLSEPVVITFDMGEEVIREPQIPHWFPGGVIDIIDSWWTQLTTNIQDKSKNQFENKNQTEHMNRFENQNQTEHKNQTENKNESEDIDQKENTRQTQKINQTKDMNESENKNKTQDKNQNEDKNETEDKNKPEKTYPDFACPKKLTCVFWNPEKYKQGNTTTGGWVGDGCSFAYTSNTNATACRCDRLANFALLMDTQGDIGILALDIISMIGCGVSTISLVVTMLTFVCIKRLRNSRPQQVVLQICLALFGLYTCFMAGIHATNLGLGCIAFGGLIHFFCLASVAWMSIEATNMYFMFVKVFNVDINHFMWKAALIGWGAFLQ